MMAMMVMTVMMVVGVALLVIEILAVVLVVLVLLVVVMGIALMVVGRLAVLLGNRALRLSRDGEGLLGVKQPVIYPGVDILDRMCCRETQHGKQPRPGLGARLVLANLLSLIL